MSRECSQLVEKKSLYHEMTVRLSDTLRPTSEQVFVCSCPSHTLAIPQSTNLILDLISGSGTGLNLRKHQVVVSFSLLQFISFRHQRFNDHVNVRDGLVSCRRQGSEVFFFVLKTANHQGRLTPDVVLGHLSGERRCFRRYFFDRTTQNG